MNIRSTIVLEVSKNERIYHLHLPFGAPYGEVYDACMEISQAILEMAKQATDASNSNSKNVDNSGHPITTAGE